MSCETCGRGLCICDAGSGGSGSIGGGGSLLLSSLSRTSSSSSRHNRSLRSRKGGADDVSSSSRRKAISNAAAAAALAAALAAENDSTAAASSDESLSLDAASLEARAAGSMSAAVSVRSVRSVPDEVAVEEEVDEGAHVVENVIGVSGNNDNAVLVGVPPPRPDEAMQERNRKERVDVQKSVRAMYLRELLLSSLHL